MIPHHCTAITTNPKPLLLPVRLSFIKRAANVLLRIIHVCDSFFIWKGYLHKSVLFDALGSESIWSVLEKLTAKRKPRHKDKGNCRRYIYLRENNAT